ncbi:thermonuclease family protein [Segeticoccus rhizosphaerae]|uniref:thermonuclease family protein n=1 Tax=Segeticoccus rhizosphaerae TaxID=1104777 RepID=UPI0013968C3A|nr:thermonuclease family protein [Segeticoccus rhizosphaerae]
MSLDGPPPGWYPDPWDDRQQRWWDGRAWTPGIKPTRQGRARRVAAWIGGGLAGFFVLMVIIGLVAPDPGTQPAGTAASTSPGASPTATPTAADPTTESSASPTSPDAAAKRKRERAAEQARRAAAAKTAAKKKAEQKEKARKARQRRKRQQQALSPVLRVVDGDTVHVAYHGTELTVRIIGIDTPETVSPSVADECGGQAATAMAHQLLDGRTVHLVRDASQGRLDKYGRTLAYLDIPGVGDYGKIMISKGLASEYTYAAAYHRQARYQAAEATARAAGRGTWGNCGGFDKPVASRPKATKPAPFAPAAPQPKAPQKNCAPGYSPCIPPYPPDLDCADVNGPITVTGSDPHGLDRDGDGVACESG